MLEMCEQIRTRIQGPEGTGSEHEPPAGLVVLFVGGSRSGRTHGAEAPANELELEPFRFDLEQLASKYIGETEKHLRRVIDAAERGGAVLLFDEAKTLFGKRSEVRDSQDRYANMAVEYRLQLVEAFQGVIVLGAGALESLDPRIAARAEFLVRFSASGLPALARPSDRPSRSP
jgi:SpoVK/Ycf46/Vps4 family AAA+-type ATPase